MSGDTASTVGVIIHTLITPQILWWIFAGAVGIAGIMSIVLSYHWKKYTYRKNARLAFMKMLYFTGLFVIIALLLVALLSYESSINA